MDLWQTLLSNEQAKQLYFFQKDGFRIEVIQNKDFYRLEINGVIQSAFANTAPYMPALSHCAVMLLPLLHDSRPTSVLELGGGGQSLQRYFKHAFPHIDFISIEADKDVNLALQSLPGFNQLSIVQTDAFEHIKECKNNNRQFDWLIVDLFAGADAPAQTKSDSFYRDLKELLNPGGWLIVNCLTDDKAQLNLLRESINNGFEISTVNQVLGVKAFAVPGQKNHIFLLKHQAPETQTPFVFPKGIEQHNLFKSQ